MIGSCARNTYGPQRTRLTVELVPSSAWGNNLRDLLPRRAWDMLRKRQAALAGNRCQTCGALGVRRLLDCHEIWEYDDATHTQRLAGLIALCQPCHGVKHIGLASLHGRGEAALRHLATVNAIGIQEARAMVEAAFAIFEKRSHFDWNLDISWLKDAEAAESGALAAQPSWPRS